MLVNLGLGISTIVEFTDGFVVEFTSNHIVEFTDGFVVEFTGHGDLT